MAMMAREAGPLKTNSCDACALVIIDTSKLKIRSSLNYTCVAAARKATAASTS